MNAKHKKTLIAIFNKPVPKNLPFRNVEALLHAIGCEVAEGDGSRISFKLAGNVITTHRPHPGKESKPYQLNEIRQFLEKAGVRP